MSRLLHELILHTAEKTPDAQALRFQGQSLSYADLATAVETIAHSLIDLGLGQGERVAVFLSKRLETVISFFAVSMAGGVFVPVNPILKAEQVAYLLTDSNARILITNAQRAAQLKPLLPDELTTLITVDDAASTPAPEHVNVHAWTSLASNNRPLHQASDTDLAAILYTSGSTGKPKGVALSHRNMVIGAKSVAHYLENHAGDRILAVLPFSFDYGFSQLTTAFFTGASVVLMDYMLPMEVLRVIERESISGLAAVPPLWIQLARLTWPEGAARQLRYVTNSGGAMPSHTLQSLRSVLPETHVYLMYGLTEAFRSTYLPPEELDRRPGSIGKAIPNVEVMVVNQDGRPCAPGEPGELVHRGPLVAMGYWNDPERTAERFRPLGTAAIDCEEEIAVWSGDTVHLDEDGFLYFVGRKDDMIKTSGYRVSPSEIEEIIYQSGMVGEAIAFGVPHPVLGQAIVVIATPPHGGALEASALMAVLKRKLPGYMVPAWIDIRDNLPRNPNGKIDRKGFAEELKDLFAAPETPQPSARHDDAAAG